MKKNTLLTLTCLLLFLFSPFTYSANTLSISKLVQSNALSHPEKTGIYVLEKGGDSLLTRAWLSDHATQSIDVQYFIWSNDNIGKLASETLLRAAKRGVKIRVLVDDFLIDADTEDLFALARHPNVDIRIYNPTSSVGTSLLGSIFNMAVNFRGSNQRMHNKLFVVDKQVAITGGRNMANEYYDFGHAFNFRDRDVLLVGEVIKQATNSFNDFWNSQYAVPVQQLIDNPYEAEIQTTYTDLWGDEENIDEFIVSSRLKKITRSKVESIYNNLHAYARDNENFLPEVRLALSNIEKTISEIMNDLLWVDASFISDRPGKNAKRFSFSLDGGGDATTALADIFKSAKKSILIQTPYLILSNKAWELFEKTAQRGVKIRINTNSLASTDNLPAFSGYSSDLDQLIDTGIEIFEYRPDAKRRLELVKQYTQYNQELPIFSLHAKTMVVDDETVYIGTFNLDPRSENLNTEVGIIVKDAQLATRITDEIELDISPGNSWNVKKDGHNNATSFFKRTKLFFWKLVPMKAIL